MWDKRFRNRREAGEMLGRALAARTNLHNVLVLGLPRGGVPVAFEVANALHAPLDVFIVRKLGVPGHEELALGAIASGGVRVLNDEVLPFLSLPQQTVDAIAAREQLELERREKQYRGERPPLDVRGRHVVVVDDGLATGSTMRAAVEALQKMTPAAVTVAVPVAARQTCDDFRSRGIDVVCLRTPEPFQAVGLWYDDFAQTEDREVNELLRGTR